MPRKISSEYIIDDNGNINITGGTVNKKCPQTIYFSLSTYIAPIKEKVSFKNTLSKIEKELRRQISAMLANSVICLPDFIFTVEIPIERMAVGKPSFMDFQVYFKPKQSFLLENQKDFYKLSREIYDRYVSIIVSNINKTLADNDFLCMKKKKDLQKILINNSECCNARVLY